MAKDVLTRNDLRRHWTARQLIGGAARSAADVARRGGWVYSAGGAGAYLALRARIRSMHRSDLDEVVFRRRELQEVPSVRGATMLVPASDVQLALAAGRRSNDERLARLVKQCGVTTDEIGRLAELTGKALEEGPATAETLRAQLPPDAVRDLGPAGRKLGESSTLAVALRELQMRGAAVRISESQRLDDPRFAWAAARPATTALDPAAVPRLLAENFLRWAAPATPSEFAWWAGIPKRAAKEAFAAIGATAVKVESAAEAWFQIDDPPSDGNGAVAFLPFRDNLLSLHRGVELFLDDATVEVLDWMNRPIAAARAESLHQNAIIAAGRLIGVWEFDPDPREVVWKLWPGVSARLRSEAAREAASLQHFIRDDLGDARYYPFDTMKTRQPRIAFARAS